jgi:hypothetical protein
LILDDVVLFIVKTDFYLQRRGKVRVTLFALLDGLRRGIAVKLFVDKRKLDITGKIPDGGYIT